MHYWLEGLDCGLWGPVLVPSWWKYNTEALA